jgi:hypothetical protein
MTNSTNKLGHAYKPSIIGHGLRVCQICNKSRRSHYNTEPLEVRRAKAFLAAGNRAEGEPSTCLQKRKAVDEQPAAFSPNFPPTPESMLADRRDGRGKVNMKPAAEPFPSLLESKEQERRITRNKAPRFYHSDKLGKVTIPEN